MQSPTDTLSTGDPGDETQRRFRYQAAYGALLCLQLLDDDGDIQEIFCEHHEDLLVRKNTGKWTGIQIKTRRPDLGPFKSDEDAILHAIQRFVLLDREFPEQFEAFVIVANCDFWRATENGKNLEYVITVLREKPSANLSGAIKDIVSDLRARCKCPKKNIVSTIGKIRLDGTVPKFEDITLSVASAIGQIPEFTDRMLPDLMNAASALIAGVLERSALTCDKPIRTHIVLSSDPEDLKVKEAVLHKRMSADLVIDVIRENLNGAVGLRTATPESLPAQPFGHHILEEKMSAGGISFQSIDLAKDHLRSAEYLLQQWLHRFGPASATMRYEQLRVIVKTQCIEAYDNRYLDDEPFGRPMLSDVRNRLKSVAESDPASVFNARYEHLLGIASLATQDCAVWWSKEFPIDKGE